MDTPCAVGLIVRIFPRIEIFGRNWKREMFHFSRGIGKKKKEQFAQTRFEGPTQRNYSGGEA